MRVLSSKSYMERQIGYLLPTPDGGWGILYFSPCPHVQPIESPLSNVLHLLADLRRRGLNAELVSSSNISWGQELYREEMREAELVTGRPALRSTPESSCWTPAKPRSTR